VVQRPRVAVGSDLRAFPSVLLHDVDVVVVKRISKVGARPARFAREHPASLQHDNILAARDELVGGGDARNTCADDTHLRLQVRVQGLELGAVGVVISVYPH